MIYPTLRQIEAFVRVAQLGSFGRAAAVLRLSQPALSQTIRQMEALLDVKLFDRTTRSVRLTALGRHFLPTAEHLMAELDRSLSDLSAISRLQFGSVTIACLSSVAFRLLPMVAHRFKERYPDVAIVVRDDNARGVAERVRSGRADFGISSLLGGDSEFAFEPLIRDRFQLVCHRDHAFAKRRSIRWDELESSEFVMMTAETGVRAELDAHLGSAGIGVKRLYEVSHLATVLGMVERKLGVSALPALACPRGDHTPVCYRPLTAPPIHRELGIITLRDKPLPPAAERFRDVMVAFLVERSVAEVSGAEVIYRAAK